jgi:hypothetical protein
VEPVSSEGAFAMVNPGKVILTLMEGAWGLIGPDSHLVFDTVSD